MTPARDGGMPVFFKSPRRVLGLFTAYYCALRVQSLLERELRRPGKFGGIRAATRGKGGSPAGQAAKTSGIAKKEPTRHSI